MDIIHKAYCYFNIISQRQNSLRNKFLLRHNIKKGCPAGQPHKNIGTFGYFFSNNSQIAGNPTTPACTIFEEILFLDSQAIVGLLSRVAK